MKLKLIQMKLEFISMKLIFYALFIGNYVYVERKLRNSVFNEWSQISISTFSMTQ